MSIDDRATKLSDPRGVVSLIIFAGAQLLDVLNLTGLIFSTQSIAEKYDIHMEEASWVMSAYSLAFGSFILLGGRLGDFLGLKRVFMIGMSTMSLCSLIIALVQNAYVVFAFRAIQGMGAAFTMPTSIGLVAHTFKGRAQAMALSLIGSAAAMGGIVGVLVGGPFTKTPIGYRGLMYLSFGLSTAFTISIYFVVRETAVHVEKAKRLDFGGTFIIVAGVILVVFGFTSASEGWSRAQVIAPIIVGTALIAFFGVYEYCITERLFGISPLIPKYVWYFPNLLSVFLITPFNYGCLYVTMYTASNQLIALRDNTPLEAAIKCLPFGIVFAFSCVLGGLLYSRIPLKVILTIAPLCDIIGASLNSQVGADEPYWKFVFPAQIFTAIGTGIFMATFMNAVVSSAPLDHQGIVSGICSTGGQLGTAITVAISTSEVGDGTKRENYQIAFYTLIGYATVAVIVTLFFINPVSRSESDNDDTESNSSTDVEYCEQGLYTTSTKSSSDLKEKSYQHHVQSVI
jgi:MFS family permease